MMLSVCRVCAGYGKKTVLHNVSFSVDAGQFLSVLGPNGVGKSTLFKCILGINPLQSGKVLVEGKAVSSYSVKEMAGKIAYVPQTNAPVFHYSVMDMVLMGTTSQLSGFASPGKKQEDIAQDSLNRLGILPLKDRLYDTLSGGERQLTLIARALAQESRILLLDEPTANLDFGNQMRVLSSMRKLADDGYTVIETTHDPAQSYMYSDIVMALKDGSVLAYGTPQQVITESNLHGLYGVDVELLPLKGGKAIACVPKI